MIILDSLRGAPRPLQRAFLCGRFVNRPYVLNISNSSINRNLYHKITHRGREPSPVRRKTIFLLFLFTLFFLLLRPLLHDLLYHIGNRPIVFLCLLLQKCFYSGCCTESHIFQFLHLCITYHNGIPFSLTNKVFDGILGIPRFWKGAEGIET